MNILKNGIPLYFDTIDSATILGASNARDITKNLTRVRSSNVWAIGIDIPDRRSNTGTVYAQFKNKYGGAGDIYCYYDVPINIYRRWITAPSKGHYFWQFLRQNYTYRKLTGDKKTKLPHGVN